jgi:hypothetical protein
MANQTSVAGAEHYGAIRRVSWGGIFAGTVVALVVQVCLTLLGLGIGLGVVSQTTATGAISDAGIAAGIWLGVSTLISLFIGGFVAARLAGIPTRPDSMLHGIVVWGLGTLVSLYLATTAVGTAVSGIAGIVGPGLKMAGQGISAVVPQDERQQIQQAIKQPEQALKQAQQEAVQTAQQAAPIASGAALGAFVALVLGAIAAALGGVAGRPKDQAAPMATRP